MNNFCADIHNNLSISLTNQGVRIGPCCWFRNTDAMANDDPWNHPRLIDIRQANKNNLLDNIGCNQCIYMEQNGGSSRRTGINQYYDSYETDLSGPRGLEISIDYTCNIACIYCGPDLSTQWRNELGVDKKKFPIRMAEHDIVALLDKIDLTNLDNIHFYGGDPFFTRTHEIILNYVDKRVGLSNIYVWYNSNGTLRVPTRVFDLWEKCRLIKVYFSIDDIGRRFEYLRYGAVWQEVEDNMLWYKEVSPVNTMFVIQPTLSCLNLYYHQELLNWKSANFNTNRLGDLTDVTGHNVFGKFELTAMPDELLHKSLQNNKMNQWIVDFASSFKHNPTALVNTINEIKLLDQRRNQCFSQIFPEIAPYFSVNI
jgi:sulfatase maturation enzyme AslB (radical SAM superfamily)